MATDELEARYARLLGELAPALSRVAGSYELDRGKREDLFQEICLALWQALPRFRGESSETTFAFRIAHNRGLSHAFRQASRRAAPLCDGLELPDPAPSPEEAAAEGQRRERLLRAVHELPLNLRQVMTLALEGLAAREIGEVLGLTEGNVAVRLTRARQALRQALGVSTTGARA